MASVRLAGGGPRPAATVISAAVTFQSVTTSAAAVWPPSNDANAIGSTIQRSFLAAFMVSSPFVEHRARHALRNSRCAAGVASNSRCVAGVASNDHQGPGTRRCGQGRVPDGSIIPELFPLTGEDFRRILSPGLRLDGTEGKNHVR